MFAVSVFCSSSLDAVSGPQLLLNLRREGHVNHNNKYRLHQQIFTSLAEASDASVAWMNLWTPT